MSSLCQQWKCFVGLAILSWVVTPFTACSAEDAKPAAKPAAKSTEKAKPAEKDTHDHPSEGPHGGALIELGEEEYHAEIVMEEKTESVIIYVLAANAKDLVPIDATEVFINLKHGNKPEQFKLKASATKTDPKGKSSRFVLKDEDLMHDLHHDDSQARLRLKIDGKSYSGKIAAADHDHDHEHDHAEKAPAPKKKG